jgi:hypothetical protein
MTSSAWSSPSSESDSVVSTSELPPAVVTDGFEAPSMSESAIASRSSSAASWSTPDEIVIRCSVPPRNSTPKFSGFTTTAVTASPRSTTVMPYHSALRPMKSIERRPL